MSTYNHAQAVEWMRNLLGRVERDEIRISRWDMNWPVVEEPSTDSHYRSFSPGREVTLTIVYEEPLK